MVNANAQESNGQVTSLQQVGQVPVIKGDFQTLPKKVRFFIAHWVHVMNPRGIYMSDGSKKEADEFIEKMVEAGTLMKLTAYKNNYLCCTDPSDTARVEGKTFIVTPNKYDTVPHVRDGVNGTLGHWMSPEVAAREMNESFPKCMTGRMMYVIPYSMGPIESPLSKVGVQLTDSSYVLLSMRIMTRVSPKVWDVIRTSGEFVRGIHSVGCPRPFQGKIENHWPCNPEKTRILHFPDQRMIKSFGSGYGGNSLLGKKCFALRIAGVIGRDEGWMAEHMLIMSVTTPANKEHFIAAAFPSACGKTNLAMLNPSLPGFKVQCVGDDIAWMRFDSEGFLRAINPENGFFGVAPGTNNKTNPIAMRCFQENSLFTNVGHTSDGRFFWDGLEKETPENVTITDWMGKPWSRQGDTRAAHPNSRFTASATQCPILHPHWDDPRGVPISAILFGGRRPRGVPLVFEAKTWSCGVMLGACLKSETTAAAEFKGKSIMHDPMAMRPFLGYNFGLYLNHWLNMEKPNRQMPKIFHVNWFRRDKHGKFLWPGFGENIRVLDWIIKRCEGDSSIAVSSPVGFLPTPGSINMSGMSQINETELFSLPKQFWLEDIQESLTFFEDQVGIDTPDIIIKLLEEQEKEFHKL